MRFVTVLVGLALGIGLSFVYALLHPATALASTVTGIITNGQGHPVTNIRVSAWQNWGGSPPMWFEEAWALTDASGAYTLTGMSLLTDPTGAAFIERISFADAATPPRYASEYYNHSATREGGAVIYLDNQNTATLNLQLAPSAQITGQINDTAGHPANNITVTVYQRVTVGGVATWAWVQGTTSDSNGHYVLMALPAGGYRVGYRDDNSTPHYATEYYPDAASLDTAATLTLTTGATMANINAQLADRGGITGLVTNKSGQPAPGVSINLYRYEQENGSNHWSTPYSIAQTGQDGRYTIVGLDRGNYRIGFVDDAPPLGYIEQFYNNAATLESATDILVDPAITVGHINAQLATKGQITGRVIDEQGHPVANCVVDTYIFDPGTKTWSQAPNSATTDATGVYTITHLADGIYHIGFFDGQWPRRYLVQYYKNARQVENATDVVVHADATTGQIDAQLAPTGHIAGQVTDEAGRPLDKVEVSIYVYVPYIFGGGEWQPVKLLMSDPLKATTDTTGAYDIPGLEPDTYRLQFVDPLAHYVPEYYNNAATVEDATDVIVAASATVMGVNAQLATVGRITGTVTDINGQPLRDIVVNVMNGVGGPSIAQSVTDAAGNYSIEGLAQGAYRVLFGSVDLTPPAPYVAQYYDKATTFAGALEIQVHTGETVNNINAQLAARGRIQGRVTNTAGEAVKDVRVTVYRQNSQSMAWSAFVNLLTDAQGNYAIGGLDPATYRLGFADEEILTGLRYLPEYYNNAGTVESATDIPVNLNQIVSDVNGQLIPRNSDSNPAVRVALHKTVGIAGITPLCTAKTEIKAPVDTPIVYCYAVQNTGNVTVTTHNLVDSHLGRLLSAFPLALAPGNSYSTTFTQTLTVSTTNVATWTATTEQQVNPTIALIQAQSTTASTAATVIISSALDDQDQDGIPDNMEGASDIDHDNQPNFLDLDADGDGFTDAVEAGLDLAHLRDSNHNGTPDFLEPNETLRLQQIFLPVVAH